MSLRMVAQTQALPGLPLALRRWQKARMAGLRSCLEKTLAVLAGAQGQDTYNQGQKLSYFLN